MPEKIPEGFTPEEWESWTEFRADARQLARGLKCTYQTALVLMAMNNMAQQLADLKDLFKRPDEPWQGGGG